MNLKIIGKDLTFESEHQLLTEPLRIDVLIIKKKRNVVIKKNIAQIFRRFGIEVIEQVRCRAKIRKGFVKACTFCKGYFSEIRVFPIDKALK